MFSKKLVILFILCACMVTNRSFSQKISRSSSNFYKMAKDLSRKGFYYSSIPWMKEYIVATQGRLGSEGEDLLKEIISRVGAAPFEQLPIRFLKYSNSGTVHYILAKKLLGKGKLKSALQELNRISSAHRTYPFVAHMKAAIYSITGNQALAVQHFKDCQSFSSRRQSSARGKVQRRQLEMNRQYCVAGVARAKFASRNFRTAELKYLDIEKEDYIWPEILFEEAWNSYYMKNYNRSLGKLVTYKAPVFDYIFNAEIEILNSLSYMRLCLYDDVKTIVDRFYALYSRPTKDLRKFLINRGRDYQYYYQLISNYQRGHRGNGSLLINIIKSISRDPAYQELNESLLMASREYGLIRRSSNPKLVRVLTKSILSVIREIKDQIGSYVRTQLIENYGELFEAFQGMSYIKLEVLSRKKSKLYASQSLKRQRGDVRYLRPNEKQYFWTFNGEFWADELGDYVFALADECGTGRR